MDKTNGTKVSITIDGEKVAEIENCSISADNIHEVIKPVSDGEDMEYNYLFTIADLILEKELDPEVKQEIPGYAWNNLINAMIEFKKATDY